MDQKRRAAEEEQRAAEKRYRSTLDHMMEGCQIIGFDWRYLYVNGVAAREGHAKSEELVGRTMEEVYPGIQSTELFSQLPALHGGPSPSAHGERVPLSGTGRKACSLSA